MMRELEDPPPLPEEDLSLDRLPADLSLQEFLLNDPMMIGSDFPNIDEQSSTSTMAGTLTDLATLSDFSCYTLP